MMSFIVSFRKFIQECIVNYTKKEIRSILKLRKINIIS